MGRPKLDMSDLIDSNVDLAPNGSGGSEAGFQIKGIIAIGAHVLSFILVYEKFLQFDWLRAVVFQLNSKYLHVKSTNLLRVVV